MAVASGQVGHHDVGRGRDNGQVPTQAGAQGQRPSHRRGLEPRVGQLLDDGDRGGGVGDVVGRTASRERHDVVDGEVSSRAAVARAPVAVLPTLGAEHTGAETLPCPRAVQGVVPAAVGLQIVCGRADGVYSAAVLRLREPVKDHRVIERAGTV